MATAKSRYASAEAAAKAFNDMPLLASSDAHSTVEIRIHASGLDVMDTFSKSNPFARLLRIHKNAPDREIGRTEVIPNTQEPQWTIGMQVDYHFEELQIYRLEVWDEDKVGSDNLEDHQLQGTCEFCLAELMTAADLTMTKILTSVKKSLFGASTVGQGGTVTLMAETLEANSEFLLLGLSGENLANKDGFFSKSDPYFEVHKPREDDTWVPVYRSIYKQNTLNPMWPAAKRISIQTLCNGDYDRPIRIEVFDYDNDGSHDDMGRAETTVRALLEMGTIKTTKQNKIKLRGLPVIETKKNGKTKESGHLIVDESGIMKYDTFVDYLKSGWEMNMMIGIDFTASNKSPADPNSLHYRSGAQGEFNQYEHAIRSLGEVISQYDHDGLYPVYGFGGKLPGTTTPSHCFALNQNPQNPSVKGVQGILDVYASALSTWGLSGPTIFTQVIEAAAALAKNSAPDPKTAGSQPGSYTILLILTDGVITDLEQTKTAIVAASKLPLSIIIVGVGDADFSGMDALDSDEQLLRDQRGRVAKRDIVQFVRFNDYKDALGQVSHGRLAKETLEELPAQMLGYFNDNNIKPKVKAGISMSKNKASQAATLSPPPPPPATAPPAPSPPPQQQQQQQALIMNVAVPPNGQGGDTLRVQVPDGREVTVQVPMGMQPGQAFQISVPPPVPDLGALGKSLLSQSFN